MSDDQPLTRGDELLQLVREAERAAAEAEPNAEPFDAAPVRAMLARVEGATPGGAPLHAQLDNVRKWLGALDRPEDHERFGGVGRLRAHVHTQLRIAFGALEDYLQGTRASDRPDEGVG